MSCVSLIWARSTLGAVALTWLQRRWAGQLFVPLKQERTVCETSLKNMLSSEGSPNIISVVYSYTNDLMSSLNGFLLLHVS